MIAIVTGCHPFGGGGSFFVTFGQLRPPLMIVKFFLLVAATLSARSAVLRCISMYLQGSFRFSHSGRHRLFLV